MIPEDFFTKEALSECTDFELLKRIGKAVTQLMGKNCEVAIHDFSKKDATLVYLQGEVTGRKIGAPISNRLFCLLREYGQDLQDQLNYRTRLPGGRIIRSSTTFIRNKDNHIIGCFCINFDITDILNMRDTLNEFSVFENVKTEESENIPESTTNEFIDGILEQAILGMGKQPAFMNRKERIETVRMLDRYGIFRLKGSVEYVANALGVTRFTIYNYLKESNR